MTAPSVEGRLRKFLLVLALLTFVTTPVELFLLDHTQELLQLVPFALCAIGLISVVVALINPQCSNLLALRISMAVIGAGGLVGVAVHLIRNYGFEQEVRPDSAIGEMILRTLKGAALITAPGVLVFAALAALPRHMHIQRSKIGNVQTGRVADAIGNRLYW